MGTAISTAKYAGTTASMQTDPEARHNGDAASVSYRVAFPITDARCSVSPSTLEWVPDREGRVVPAEMTALCRRCPGRQACLSWARAGYERGYWAGTTTKDRAQLASADLREADALQRQHREEACAGALHEPGEGSYQWYRKGCPCAECRAGNALQRAHERARARQRRTGVAA